MAGLAAVGLAAVGGPAGGTPAGTAPVRLVDQSRAVAPDSDFVLSVSAPGAPAVEVVVHDRVRSRIQFTRTTTGDRLTRRIFTTGAIAVPPDGPVTVRLPTTGADGPQITQPGVYPVAVQPLDRDSAAAGEPLVTYLVRLPDADDDVTPLAVTLVVALGAAPGLDPGGSVEVVEADVERLGGAADALVAHRGLPVVLQPTPETIDALAADTGGATMSAIERLRTAVTDRQVLVSPYAPVDVAGLVAAGLTDELQMHRTRGGDVLAEELLIRPDPRSWVADPTIDLAAMNALRPFGVDQVVIPEAALAPLDLERFPITLVQPFLVSGTDGRQRAIAADAGLAAHRSERPDDAALAAQHLLADLTVLYFDRPGLERGTVVTAEDPDPAWLRWVLDGLAVSRVLDPVGLDDLFAAVPLAATDGTGDGDPLRRALTSADAPDLSEIAAGVHEARRLLAGLGSMLGADSPRVDDLGRHVLLATSTALPDAERRSHLGRVRAATEAVTSGVQAPDRQAITLTSRTGAIPLTIRNDGDVAVRVAVDLQSEKLDFPDGETLDITLPPGTTRLDIAVTAQASGDSPMQVRVRSPDGTLALTEVRFTIRSTAVSGVGLVLSIGALAFLSLWWAMHWRTTRRDRRLVTPDSRDERSGRPSLTADVGRRHEH